MKDALMPEALLPDGEQDRPEKDGSTDALGIPSVQLALGIPYGDNGAF